MAHAEKLQSRTSPLLPILAVLVILYFAREVLVPLSLAVLVAFLLTPAVKRLESLRLGRIPSVILVVFISFTLFAGLAWIAGNQLIDAINALPNYKENIRHKVNALRSSSTSGLAKAGQSVKEITKELAGPPPEALAPTPGAPRPVPAPQEPVPVRVVDPPPTVLGSLRSMFGPLLAPVGTALVVLVFAMVMLVKREDLRSRLLRLIAKNRLSLATEAFDDAARRVSRYLRLQFLVNTAFGVLITGGLYFIGVPTPLLWGVLAGALRFVPYVGPVFGAGLPILVSLAVFDHWLQPLLCAGLFLVVEPVTAYVVEPALYGSHTGVSSLAILVAATMWTVLWGPVGLVLSTPLTVCVMVIGRYVPQFEFLNVMLGDEPVLTPSAQLYQRLLAMDHREAHAIVDRYLENHTLAELYDAVLIPALNMVEEDRHRESLGESRERFVLQSLEEFIADLADYNNERTGLPLDRADLVEGPRASAASGTPRVVCLAAGDKADEISAAMLSQVLERLGYATVSLPVVTAPADVLETLAKDPGDVVCISALPPFALINARSMSKSLRARFPELKIVVGLWGFSGGGVRAGDRLAKAFTVDVVTTLAQAAETIGAASHVPSLS